MNFNSIYGLHSQTQFVPEALIERATVTASNASAEFGGFQGGVVNYELIQPSRMAHGGVSLSFSSAALSDYKLGTADGTNPDDRPRPDWSKWNFATHQTLPVGAASALLFGYSARRAEATKTVDPQYRTGTVDSQSRADYLLLGFSHDTASGGTFRLTGNWSDYAQDWFSPYVDQQEIRQTSRAKALQAHWSGQLSDRAIAGVALRNLRFALDGSYQDNATENLANANVYYSWYGRYSGTAARPTNYVTDAFDAWCDTTIDYSGTGIACRQGGIGDRAYDDQRLRLSGRLSGDIWAGSFRLGGAVEQLRAGRSGEGYVFNSASKRLETGSFVCPPGADDCIDTQYFTTRIVQQAYDVTVDATKAEAWLELDQSWGDFGLRAGLRADYNDYLQNLDIAPRMVATWTPAPDVSFSFGANRYYSDDYLTYAIHDAVPRGENQRRSDTGGVVGDWVTATDLGYYSYAQGNLRTPYTDELSFAAIWHDTLFGGQWRARLTDRRGKDQFAGRKGDEPRTNELTNDGTSRYKSFALEYDKKWHGQSRGALDYVGLNLSAVVAERRISAESYFGAATGEPEEFIWYKDQSYTRSEFDVVTGQFDIPLRAAVELNGSWKDGRYKAGLSAGVTFGYTGARCQTTSANDCAEATRTNPDQGAQPHLLYEEYKYKPVVTLNLSAQARIAEVAGNPMMLDLKIANLLNERGNQRASTSNPWIPGRSVWLGSSLEW